MQKKIFKDASIVKSELKVAENKENFEQSLELKNQQQKLVSQINELPELEQRFAAREVDAQIIAEVVALWTGIPVTKITFKKNLKSYLKWKMILNKKLLARRSCKSSC